MQEGAGVVTCWQLTVTLVQFAGVTAGCGQMQPRLWQPLWRTVQAKPLQNQVQVVQVGPSVVPQSGLTVVVPGAGLVVVVVPPAHGADTGRAPWAQDVVVHSRFTVPQ